MSGSVTRACAEELRATYERSPASRVAALARRFGVSFEDAFEVIAARGVRWRLCIDLWKDRIDRTAEIARATGVRVVPEPELAARYAEARRARVEAYGRRLGRKKVAPRRIPYPTPAERLVGAALSKAMRARAGRAPPPAP